MEVAAIPKVGAIGVRGGCRVRLGHRERWHASSLLRRTLRIRIIRADRRREGRLHRPPDAKALAGDCDGTSSRRRHGCRWRGAPRPHDVASCGTSPPPLLLGSGPRPWYWHTKPSPNTGPVSGAASPSRNRLGVRNAERRLLVAPETRAAPGDANPSSVGPEKRTRRSSASEHDLPASVRRETETLDGSCVAQERTVGLGSGDDRVAASQPRHVPRGARTRG